MDHFESEPRPWELVKGSCQDAVIVLGGRFRCHVRGRHDVHETDLGTQVLQWGGPVGRTWFIPEDVRAI